MNIVKVETVSEKIDSKFLINFFIEKGENLNSFLEEILENINPITANNNIEISINGNKIKWMLFWKSFVQYLGLAKNYDTAKFNSAKQIFIDIKNGKKVNFEKSKDEQEKILHPDDFEKIFKRI